MKKKIKDEIKEIIRKNLTYSQGRKIDQMLDQLLALFEEEKEKWVEEIEKWIDKNAKSGEDWRRGLVIDFEDLKSQLKKNK